jgi:type II secretory pathway pseudopilin PulG
MTTPRRRAFTLFQLLLVLVLLALLFALLLPFIAKAREQALRDRKLNNLRQLALAVHNYASANNALPAGNDDKNFSAAAKLLPYIEQDQVFKKIDFTKAVDDPANGEVRGLQIKTFLSPLDPQGAPNKDYGATNYLFNAGSKPSLKDNDGVFFQNSKINFPDIIDGTSNTLMIGETLKGDGGTKAADVKRQHVRLKADALKELKDDAGVQDFKDDKNIAGDRCASWMDGRFLQGTFTGTRQPNDARPDVDCGGAGGFSALRSIDELVGIAMCDGSTRLINSKKITKETWKALMTRNGGEVLGPDF